MAEQTEQSEQQTEEPGDQQQEPGKPSPNDDPDRERLIPEEEISDDGQVYVDRDNIDFDPEDGLYSGTAVDGSTDIPGPHEQADDVEPGQSEDEGSEDGEE